MQAIVIKQQVGLRKCGCTHTCWTKKYYLPACVAISSKALCADDLLPSTIPVLYLLSRVHVSNCWYHWHSLAISIPFSLCPVKSPCPTHSYRPITMHNRSAYGQPVPLVHVHRHTLVNLRTAGCTHTGPSPLSNNWAQGNPAVLIQARHHYAKCQPKDSRPHLDNPIATRQQNSLGTAGRPDTGPHR